MLIFVSFSASSVILLCGTRIFVHVNVCTGLTYEKEEVGLPFAPFLADCEQVRRIVKLFRTFLRIALFYLGKQCLKVYTISEIGSKCQF
jgi:hypothetical protein